MKIIASMGNPNGVGIEVLLKSLKSICDNKLIENDCEFAITGNYDTIKYYSDSLRMPVKFTDSGLEISDIRCKIINSSVYSKVLFGKDTKEAGKASAEAIEKALDLVIKKEYDALITMPISKTSMNLAGWNYPGHTELLADRCNVEKPLMILCSRTVRVGLATIHTPISDVSKSIKRNDLVETIDIFNKSLKKDFGFRKPLIAVLGLNPHAGENGRLGNEEIDIISPAIDKCNILGMNVQGPYPADGFFAHGDYSYYDGIFAMYHDQGLIPLKMLARGHGVNVTAGLPIVRTSPDHGTAFNIAGRDKADESSAVEAFLTAGRIVRTRQEFEQQL